MDWDLENENQRLQDMIIIYQEEIETLEAENQELKKEVLFLKSQLEFKSLGEPTYEETSET
tara:strand:+ start:98 stop:280 length:183 start_codon:yes stop_codon:yes gene_type:complete